MAKGSWIVDEWAGCYPSNWKGVVVTEAMTHPAKFSSKLIRRIYEHITAERWVKAGDGVLDPFGGVGLGALDAMRLGLHWTGVELEEKFWKIGNENIEKWMREFGKMPRWGTARLLHGDSRKLVELVVKSGRVTVSSPPYSAMQVEKNAKSIDRTKQYEAYKASGGGQTFEQFCRTQDIHSQGYGHSDGQLANMQVISSPPFLQSEGGTPEPKPGGVIDAAMYERHKAGNKSAGGYGDSEGQLHHMAAGADSFELAVSSPPFENSLSRDNVTAGRVALARELGISNSEHVSPIDMERIGKREQTYGETEGQLGADSGDDFWMAARRIVEQVYEALEPGGHASWVVKDYVKNKQVVPFADQWRQLCEAVGFVTVHEHRAMLVHHKGRQGKLDGGHVEIKTESKSFFRRLAEKKGSPRIDWEVVWCMVKPIPSGADALHLPNPADLGEGV